MSVYLHIYLPAFRSIGQNKQTINTSNLLRVKLPVYLFVYLSSCLPNLPICLLIDLLIYDLWV